jgi:hypothetical protein
MKKPSLKLPDIFSKENSNHDMWVDIKNAFVKEYDAKASNNTWQKNTSAANYPWRKPTTAADYPWHTDSSSAIPQHNKPHYPYRVPDSWDSWKVETNSNSDPQHITITDENGCLKKLSIAEVSRYYAEALEYRRVRRFARIFPAVRDILNELFVAIKLHDPLDEKELDNLEKELKS